MRLGLSLWVNGILIDVALVLCVILDLVLGVDIKLGSEMDAENVVNIFSSCCLFTADTYSQPFTFLYLAAFPNSSLMKFGKFDIITTTKNTNLGFFSF